MVRAGKGGKTAQTWIPEQGLPSVRRWLEIRGDHAEAVLEVSYEAIYPQVRELGERAGLDSVSPHDLRRTACTLLLAAGVKPHLVQRQMRHSDFGTTQRYDHTQREEVRSAVAALPLGFEDPKSECSMPSTSGWSPTYLPAQLLLHPIDEVEQQGNQPLPERPSPARRA